MRILDGVEVHDLVPNLPAIVVVQPPIVIELQVFRVRVRDPVGVREEGAPVDEVGRVAHAVGQHGRAQRGGHRVAQRQQRLAAVQIRRIAGEGHAQHQPEVPQGVVEARGERGLRAAQQVLHALARELAEQVLVGHRPPKGAGLLGLVLVLHAQVGVLAQLVADVRRGEQVELQAGVRRAVGVERNQHLSHALVGARLRHHFQKKAHAVAVHEELLFGEVGRVGQPAGELFGRRVCWQREGEEQCRAELAGRRFGGGYAHGGLTANGRPGPPEAG